MSDVKEKKYKILCIEDEVDVRDTVTEVMRDEGFEIIEAIDGEDGYNKFLEENPDVIISDIMMPKMSGYELLKKIRTTKRKDINPNVPFIFLSALSQKDDIIKGSHLYANDYMVKPVDIDILLAKVKEKIKNYTAIEKNYKDNLDNLCLQVSNILSNDLEEQINTLTKIASILKTRPYGPFGHRKYDQVIDKIYMIGVKLQSIVQNSVNTDSMLEKISMEENIIDPEKFVHSIIEIASKSTNRDIVFEMCEENLPNLKVNTAILRKVLESVLIKVMKITNVSDNLKFDLFIDYNGKMAFAIHGNIKNDMNNESKEILNLEKEITEIEKQSGLLEKEIRNNEVVVIVTLPQYRFVKKN
jgi:DNA-binding response OmpR family regulator